MLIYAILMLVMAIVFAIIATQIYKGKTKLIHNYHQTKVQNKAAYGKAFGKAMSILPASMTLSGLLAVVNAQWMVYAVGVLLLGLVAGVAVILKVQKKYNGGLF